MSGGEIPDRQVEQWITLIFRGYLTQLSTKGLNMIRNAVKEEDDRRAG